MNDKVDTAAPIAMNMDLFRSMLFDLSVSAWLCSTGLVSIP
jgi:hypothetical protein